MRYHHPCSGHVIYELSENLVCVYSGPAPSPSTIPTTVLDTPCAHGDVNNATKETL